MRDTVAIPGYAAVATTTCAADRYVYLIDSPSKRCRAENASCRAFGRPNLTPDRKGFDLTNPFETVLKG